MAYRQLLHAGQLSPKKTRQTVQTLGDRPSRASELRVDLLGRPAAFEAKTRSMDPKPHRPPRDRSGVPSQERGKKGGKGLNNKAFFQRGHQPGPAWEDFMSFDFVFIFWPCEPDG